MNTCQFDRRLLLKVRTTQVFCMRQGRVGRQASKEKHPFKFNSNPLCHVVCTTDHLHIQHWLNGLEIRLLCHYHLAAFGQNNPDPNCLLVAEDPTMTMAPYHCSSSFFFFFLSLSSGLQPHLPGHNTRR